MNLHFKAQFRERLIDGRKTCTVRKGNRWKPGMTAHCRIGSRFKSELLFERPVLAVASILIQHWLKWENDQKVIDKSRPVSICINGIDLPQHDVRKFMVMDGFATEADFIAWFLPEGKPFEGQWVIWDNFGTNSAYELYKEVENHKWHPHIDYLSSN